MTIPRLRMFAGPNGSGKEHAQGRGTKEHYWRDIARVKGGLEDYMVIGALEVGRLRTH